ncbi:response regulator transcription factor [Psychromonas sp. Urea-02u-13]|uniref:response regulator transcription factor n=1 Tax=Psychromonas sp. Urea-02u-13 TaxID=2058326 RepID=UPI000C334DE5|nr:response regulator transcription factor [Psychromonas sp. Urea-02u-13]PKG37655.1 DNA-binding response regulator [Psychromonas sp. Urea-02u-13]
MYKILVADDHPLFRDAIANIITTSFHGASIEQTEDIGSTLEYLKCHDDLDLILLDLNMPGMSALQGLLTLRTEHPTIPVVIISAERDKQTILQTLSYGAVGFIAKSSSKAIIVEAVESIFAGNVYLPADIMRLPEPSKTNNEFVVLPEQVASLTPRELMVLKNLTQGEANKQIAFNLHISEATVKTHVSSILKKLGASNRVKVVLGCADIDFNQHL